MTSKIKKFFKISIAAIFFCITPTFVQGRLYGLSYSFLSAKEEKNEIVLLQSVFKELPPVNPFEILALIPFARITDLQDEDAIQAYKKFLPSFRKNNYKFNESLILSMVAAHYASLGNYNEAISYSKKSLAIAKVLKNSFLEALSYNSFGVIYSSIGEYKLSFQYLKSGLLIIQNLKKNYSNHILSSLFPLVEGSTMANLSIVYAFSLKDYDQAILYADQSLTIARERNYLSLSATALNILGGSYYGKKQYKVAIEYFQKGLIDARKALDNRREGYILNYMGLAFFKSHQLEAAESTLYQGIAVWESIRSSSHMDGNKVSLLDVHAKIYRSLQQVLIARNKPEEALEIAERGRSRALVEILAKRSANISVNDVSIAPPNIQAIQSIAKTHNATLVEYSILYQESEVEEVKPSTKEAQLLIWVVKPTGEISLRQVDLASQPKSLKQSVLELLDERSDSLFSSIGTPQAKLQHLHKLLIQPIADLLPPEPTAPVIFIPQDVLYRVPFVSLQDERGKYLIEQHTVLSAPSIQVLDLTYQQHQRLRKQGNGALTVGVPRSGIIVGNPTGANLKAAEKEAIAIAAILETQALIGQDATKSRVLARLSDAKVIHLATHGKYVDDKGAGLQSALAFAPAGQDQGLLTASEIFDLKLSANLVVLSACNSGRGEITGEGVIGLSRAFIAAGVPSLVLSLWSITDEDSAVVFMQQFYENLKQGKDKAQALRQAMLYMVQKGKPVRDWAAFTLIGESEL